MGLVMRRIACALLAFSLASAGASVGAAQGAVVVARMPVERRAEMLAALRLELAGRATLLEGPVLEGEPSVAAIREDARAAGASHVVWVVFPGGLLAPAEVRVLDVERTAPAHGSTAQAWDVVDARVVAVLAGSLFEAGSGAAVGTGGEGDPVVRVVVDVEVVDVVVDGDGDVTDPAFETESESESETESEAETESESESESARGTARDARTFSLGIGTGIEHGGRMGGAWGPELGWISLWFYGRMTHWAALGVRARLGALGYSSIQGLILRASVALPSVAFSFRESLGTAAAVELGVHVEPGLFIENLRRTRDGGTVTDTFFGLGGGAFVTLELGAANAVTLDYSIDVYGLGTGSAWNWGNATLAYVHRWD